MFEQQAKRSRAAKALTIAAIGMGIGFSTCGVNILTVVGGHRGSNMVGVAGAALFFLSLLAALITILILVGNYIVESLRK